MNADSSRKARIYITGFMGSGKSTVGPILANTIGYDFADLDRTIEREEKTPISEIFRVRGEEYFRSLERLEIGKLSTRSHIVVSLGGGTLSDQWCLQTVVATGILVYLKLSQELLFKRLRNRSDRPLLTDVEGNRLPETALRERVHSLYQAREPIYAHADITVEPDERRVGVTIDRLVQALAPFLK
jgi:shikimate kinase